MVAKVSNKEGWSICKPFLLPFYDQQRFPFLMSRGYDNDFFIVNTKDGTMQTLVKTTQPIGNDLWQGFVIKVGERAFDFHFCSLKEDDDKKWYE